MIHHRFGNRLKELLDTRGVSIRQCSEQTGIDKATISRIINGKRQVNLKHLDSFAAYFNIPISDLISAANYSTDTKEKQESSSIHTSIEDIQKILESSNVYSGNFSIEEIHWQLRNYEQHAQTEEGKQTIHTRFEEKVNKVEGIGPFINQLKDLYNQFVHNKSTPYELAIIGSALLYFIIPVDVIPDYIFPIGYIDDAIAVQIALKSLSN